MEREKQTVNRSDKGFLFELGEIRVAYGEVCLSVIEMMWMTEEGRQGYVPIELPRGAEMILHMWQMIEMHVMLLEAARVWRDN